MNAAGIALVLAASAHADILSVTMHDAPFGWGNDRGGVPLLVRTCASGDGDLTCITCWEGRGITVSTMGRLLPGLLSPGQATPTDPAAFEYLSELAWFSSDDGGSTWHWGGDFMANQGWQDPLEEAEGIGRGYKGFMVATDAGPCFGWVLIDNSGPEGPLSSFRVVEWAVERTPWTPILAGDTGPDCGPTAEIESPDVTVQPGSDLRLTARVSGRRASMRWLRDGQEVQPGHASGTTTPWLDLGAVTPADGGVYTLEVTDDCGTVTSPGVRVDVSGPCAPLSGWALALDGTGNAVVEGFGDAADPRGDMTIEFWQWAQAPAWQTTFNTIPVNEGSRFLFHGPFADGRVYWDFGICNPDFGHCDSPTQGRVEYLPPEPITGSWQHFALVADHARDRLCIYRNGVLESSSSGIPTINLRGAALAIGGGPSYHGMLAGLIDEFRVWTRARTPDEIRAFMRSTMPPGTDGLLAYYRFDAAEGGSAEDLSGNGRPAVLSDGATLTRLRACCPADFNADGFLDSLDYTDFVGCFETGSCTPGSTADFTRDGFVDFFDYTDFIAAFEAGC